MGVSSVEMFVKVVRVFCGFEMSVNPDFRCLYTDHIQQSLDSNNLKVSWYG